MRPLPRSRFRLLLTFLLPACAGFALSLLVPWFEDGYGRGLTVHVLAVVLTAMVLFWGARDRARERERERDGTRVTAVVVDVEPPPRRGHFPGHAVTLEFTDRDGRRRNWRDASGMGGYALEPGDRVVLRLVPGSPENPEAVEIVGSGGRHPVAEPGSGWHPWAFVTTLLLAVFLTVAVVLGPLYGLPASVAGTVPALLWWIGVFFLHLTLIAYASEAGLHGRATGEVTRVLEEKVVRSGSLHTEYSFTVRFSTPDGRRVHLHLPHGRAWSCPPGTRVAVRYDLDHPPRFGVRRMDGNGNSGRRSFVYVWICLLNAALFLSGAAWYAFFEG